MGIFKKIHRSIRGPRHHLAPEEKEWTERRLLWLKEQFGPGPLSRAPLDPKSPLLPRKWDGSPEAGADLLMRMCEFMGVDQKRLDLDYYSASESHEIDSAHAGEWHRSGPAGLFIHPEDSKRLVIALEESGLAQPASLAATICHELAHVHLLADRRIAHTEEDCEPLTDLLTVYFGAGIFTANSAFQFNQWQSDTHQGWSTSRQGYLSEGVFGYALAGYAWLRGESAPPWANYLRENIRYYFDDAEHFLTTTRDTTLPFHVCRG